MAAGSSFVALSRLKNISGCLIQPMPFQQLQSISKLTRLQERIREEQRLRAIHVAHVNVLPTIKQQTSQSQ